MKNLFKRIGMVFAAILVAVAAVPLGGVIGVYAASEAPNLKPDAEPSGNNDGVMLSKQAVPVDGYNNMWDITLKIESPKVSKTSDTILVIDRSGSMAGSKMTSAKNAALDLAARLLPAGNTTNQVAVISFADNATQNAGFSNSYTAISTAINGLDANGGTFTQGAMRAAANLMSTSTAQIKNIILLSDGEPTYSYGFTRSARNDNNNFESNGDSKSTVAKTVFTTSIEGDGSSYRDCTGIEVFGWCPSGKYYNHGNSAIAEAGYYKTQNIGGIYTIAFDVANNQRARDVLTGMADDGKMYLANESNLADVFNQIAGIITNLIHSATVEDLMGDGIVISEQAANGICLAQGVTCTDGGKITWTPTFTYDAALDKYVATLTYRVEADENNNWENGNSFKLNEEAKITYNGDKIAYFPTPTIPKPMMIKVKKEMGQNDQTPTGTKFDMEITGPAGFTKETFSLGKNDTKTIVKAFPVGSYGITENGINSSTPINGVTLDNYDVSYSSKTFNIAQGQTTDVNIIVTNTYETTTVTASKEWKDSGDQDGKRAGMDAYFAVMDGSTVVDYKKIDILKDTDDFTSKALPKNRNGQPIDYTVVEATGCETATGCKQISGKQANGYDVSVDSINNLITNSYKPETVNIAVRKTWNDDNDRDGLRNAKAIKFCVESFANNVKFDEVCSDALGNTNVVFPDPFTEKEDFEVQFNNLPKYQPGKQKVEVKYKVKEYMGVLLGKYTNDIPDEYLIITDNNGSYIGSLSIENTHISEKRKIDVEVVWDDDGDKDGARPKTGVEVKLSAKNDSSVSKTITMSGSEATWNSSFDNQFTYGIINNVPGTEIEYEVSQVTVVDGYDTFVSGDMANGFTIANVRQKSVEVRIEWDDVNNKDGSRPAHVEVELMMDGIVASPSLGIDASGAMSPIVGATESCGSWCIRFINLPAKKQNSTGALEEVVWGVKPTMLVAGYTRAISGDMKNGYVIKYSHKPTVSSPNTGFNTANSERNGAAVENNMVMFVAMPVVVAMLGMFAIIAKRKEKEAAKVDKKA